MSRSTSIARKEGDPWTAEEIADSWRVTAAHITNLANRGEIPGVKLGSIWRFDPEEVRESLVNRSRTIRQPRSEKSTKGTSR